MLAIKNLVKEIQGIDPHNIPPEILASDQPLILKGLARAWPLVGAGLQSDEEAMAYLRSFYTDKTVGTFLEYRKLMGFISITRG